MVPKSRKTYGSGRCSRRAICLVGLTRPLLCDSMSEAVADVTDDCVGESIPSSILRFFDGRGFGSSESCTEPAFNRAVNMGGTAMSSVRRASACSASCGRRANVKYHKATDRNQILRV